MANVKLSDEVRAVLERATVDGNVLYLPEGQLDRKLYEAVNKALTNAGGKWKTRVGHVFPTDAAPKLAAMLGTGVSVDEKKRDQAFFTPEELGKRVATVADVVGCSVLEPSAGSGQLALACWLAGASTIDCIEQNSEHEQHLTSCGFGDVFIRDFLSVLPADLDKEPYERIVMNPPFTRNQDIAHVLHALNWLAPGGILTAIMLNNQTRKGFEKIEAYDPGIEDVPRAAFKEAGTDAPTIIVKIELD